MNNKMASIMHWAWVWLPRLRLAGPAAAEQKEVLIGMQCDRTGATQITGVVLCPAMHDYYELINAAGGVEGYKIKADEIDNEYKVPQAVEAYQRHKQEGAVLMTLYGTPMTVALNQRLEEDKIATTSPGFGISAAADGNRYPYLFPIAATYWSQGAAAVQFVKDKLGGNLKGKKIAYVFYDNPAGQGATADHRGIAEAGRVRAADLRRAAARCRGRRAGARHHPALPAGFRDRAPLRPVAGGGDQGLQVERLSAVEGGRPGLGVLRGRHRRGGRLWRRRRLSRDAVRRRRRRLSGPPANQGDVQEGRQGAARPDGQEHGLLQPWPAAGGDPCRRHPQRAEGDRRQASRPAPTSRRASSRSAISPWAVSSRRSKSRRPTTKAAAGCRSSRSRAANSSRRPTGSAPIAMSSTTR